jgi:putative endonuclease
MKPLLSYNAVMHIVYILKSYKDPSRCYVGITEDLEKRLQEHNAGPSYYSKRYTPWYVETYITFRDQRLAGEFEKYLKKGSGQAFLTKRLLPQKGEAK